MEHWCCVPISSSRGLLEGHCSHLSAHVPSKVLPADMGHDARCQRITQHVNHGAEAVPGKSKQVMSGSHLKGSQWRAHPEGVRSLRRRDRHGGTSPALGGGEAAEGVGFMNQGPVFRQGLMPPGCSQELSRELKRPPVFIFELWDPQVTRLSWCGWVRHPGMADMATPWLSAWGRAQHLSCCPQ